MKTLSLLLFTLLPLTGHAELNVIADLGGEDAAPYFEAVNKQPGMSTGNDTTSSPPSPVLQGEAAMLPVFTPELRPGSVADRPLQLPGIGALFLVGDDALSRDWLKANAGELAEQHAAGMIVNVTDMAAVRELRELAPGVSLAPASGSELARRLQIAHYPVLITDTGLTQQAKP
ncbi:integrating conjugative element protein [Citrobacter freundii]|uniref:integrating conjugative element protein n=1 Tax=Citrobacter freundii TaxID=546 RepID=UPI001388632D|nr:integrating conjugative element protein [Salmonella enterica]EDW6137447.1 integrating conjugative element protein [Salmonella enterica subsp. enterica]